MLNTYFNMLTYFWTYRTNELKRKSLVLRFPKDSGKIDLIYTVQLSNISMATDMSILGT